MTAQERAKADAARYTPRFTTEAPKRMVRPELPNNYDATMGRNKWGNMNASDEQYLENNRKMYSLVEVPQPQGSQAQAQAWQAPTQADAVSIARRFGGGAQAQNTAMYAQRGTWGAPAPAAAAIAGRYAAPSAPLSTEADAFTNPGEPVSSWTSGALPNVNPSSYSGPAPAVGSRWSTKMDAPTQRSSAEQTMSYYRRKAAREPARQDNNYSKRRAF